MISALVQSGLYPDSVKQLEMLSAGLHGNASDRTPAAYVKFHLLNAEYGQSLQVPKPNVVNIKLHGLKNL